VNKQELTGQAETHLQHSQEPEFSAQPLVVEAFLEMKLAASQAGFILHPVSAHRDLQSQLAIWNEKFDGSRPLFSEDGKELDPTVLSADEKVVHILRWSALPGGSRHHWGTDIDVIDLNSVPDNYRIKLLPEEFTRKGIFSRLNEWLDSNIEKYGFFKPYRTFRGGVLPEPWHLSFGSIAELALEDLSIKVLEGVIERIDISGKAEVLKILPEIFRDYIRNIDTVSIRTK